jgi:hypothetical protein
MKRTRQMSRIARTIRRNKKRRIPVTYVGLQNGYGRVPDFIMVNIPSGSTIKYDPKKHTIMKGGKNAI